MAIMVLDHTTRGKEVEMAVTETEETYSRRKDQEGRVPLGIEIVAEKEVIVRGTGRGTGRENGTGEAKGAGKGVCRNGTDP